MTMFPLPVIPAKAGTHHPSVSEVSPCLAATIGVMGPRLRGDDELEA